MGLEEYHSKYFLEQNKTEGQYLDGITAPYLCGVVKTGCGWGKEPQIWMILIKIGISLKNRIEPLKTKA